MRWLAGIALAAVVAGVAWWLLGPQRTPGADAARTDLTKVTLRVYGWTGYFRPFDKNNPNAAEYETGLKRFMRQRGFEVTVDSHEAASVDDMLAKSRSGEVDLISPPNDKIADLNRAQVLQDIDLRQIPNFNQINPLILAHHYYRAENQDSHQALAVPFVFGPYGLIYNTAKLGEPTSYQVLWDPKYAGRVSISNAFYKANIYMTALMLKMPTRDLFNLSEAQLGEIEPRLAQLCRTQVPPGAFWDDQFDVSLRDRIDIATDWGVGANKINTANWGRWALVIPDEGATAFVDNWCIAIKTTGPQLQAAHAFIDYMLSPEVQALVARVTTYSPVNFYATRHLTPDEKIKFHVTDPNYLGRLILWQPLAPEVERRYEALWKRVKP